MKKIMNTISLSDNIIFFSGTVDFPRYLYYSVKFKVFENDEKAPDLRQWLEANIKDKVFIEYHYGECHMHLNACDKCHMHFADKEDYTKAVLHSGEFLIKT